MMSTVALALQHEFVGINSCIFVVGLLLCLLASALIKRHQVYQLPECGAFMVVGFIGGCFAQLSTEAERQFVTLSPTIVFFIILPPIILDAGYSLKRKDFFDNIGPVVLLATVGTILNNLIFGYMMYAMAKAGWIPLDSSSPLECLLFGSVVSATDPVATLSLMGSKLVGTDPMLYSLVMGESILNDAIAIVLYKVFENSVEVGDDGYLVAKVFTGRDLIMSLLEFVGISLGSVVCGVLVGLACSLLCKRISLIRFPISELSLVTLFAYLSYFLAEMMYLSGIMSLFFCSICLAHYNYYNLTPVAQVALHESFHSNAQIAETALYGLLGVTTGLSLKGSSVTYNMALIGCTIIIALIARAVHVFSLCGVSNYFRQPSGVIPLRMQIPIWFAGLRGGVSFALSLSFPGAHCAHVMGATLILVLVTTFGGGGLTLPLLRCTGMTSATATTVAHMQDQADQSASHSQSVAQGSPDEDESGDADLLSDDDAAVSPDADVVSSNDDEIESLPPAGTTTPPRGLVARFRHIDETYLRVLFGARPNAGVRSPSRRARPVRRRNTNSQEPPSIAMVRLHLHEDEPSTNGHDSALSPLPHDSQHSSPMNATMSSSPHPRAEVAASPPSPVSSQSASSLQAASA